MFKRRNFLLHCSVLMNIAVLLYICSHLMIGSSDNMAMGPAFVIQEDYGVKAAPAALIRSNGDVTSGEKKAAAAVEAAHQQLQSDQQQPKYVDPDGPIDPVDSNQVNIGTAKS